MKTEKILLDNSPTISNDYDEDAIILNQQIENYNIKNIAIVARLGAGKSSLIETYIDRFRTKKKIIKNNYKNKDGKLNRKSFNLNKKNIKKHNKNINKANYVKLSLSTFNGKDYQEDEIERSILQQLLYSQCKEKLPNSKIERTNNPSFWKTFLFASVLTIFIISSILFGAELSTLSIFGNYNWTKYLFLGLIIMSFGYILFHCLYYKTFKKIKYKDFEMETKNDKDSSSIINKLIDEILYFFECINIDLVIFEDLDRLPSADIFIKLRELNTIINNSSNKKCKKITFLYAIKSEVIEDEEQRAKFFDFILSIVPIVNPSTTEEKIREIIEERNSANNNYSLTDEYIKDISLYILDMRILKNTFNDYFITKNRIVNENNKNRISNEKLFTLSLYRNIFPSEYAKLEKNEGVLPTILNKKNLIKTLTDKLEVENQNYENEIENIKNESLQKFEELIYMLKGILTEASYKNTYNSTQNIPINSLTTFENLNIDKLAHPLHNSYKIDINQQTREVINNINFFKREQNIKAIAENKIEKLSNQIEENKKKKQKLNALSFAELTDLLGIEKIFNNEFINENKDFDNTKYDKKLLNFLKFMIKNKYVDDKYSEYTHNLSSSIISQSDIEFIKKVQSETNDFYYKIENVEEVIKRLKRDDFKNNSIINKSLLLNLDKIQDQTKKINLFSTLSSLSYNSWKYVLDFFMESNNEDIILLTKFLINDSQLCKKIINSNLVESKKHIIINTIINSEVNIKNYNLDNCLTNYFSTQNDVKNILKEVSNEKVISVLENLQPKFLYLSDGFCLKEQLEYIISNSLYELTKENLIFVLKFNGNFDNELFSNNTYNHILDISNTISEYANQNINEFVSNILLNEDIINSKENAKFVSELIYNNNISNENKKGLISKFDIEIKNINLIEDELLEKILEFNRMTPLWDNLIYIYKKMGLEESFLNYISKNLDKIDKIKISEVNKDLILDLLNSDYYENFEYNCLATMVTNQLTLNEIKNENNIIRLIKLGKFDYDPSAFNILKEFPNALNMYLNHFEIKIEQELNIFFTTDITTEILNSILLSEIVPNSLKQKLIIQFSKKIKISGFEQDYAKLFINNKFVLSNSLLFQFTESNVDKYTLITLTNIDYSEPNVKTEIKKLLCSCNVCFKELFDNKKAFKIPNTKENNLWISKIEKAGILKITRYGRNITFKEI